LQLESIIKNSILVDKGQIIKYGKPEQVLTTDILRDVFRDITVIALTTVLVVSIYFTGL